MEKLTKAVISAELCFGSPEFCLSCHNNPKKNSFSDIENLQTKNIIQVYNNMEGGDYMSGRRHGRQQHIDITNNTVVNCYTYSFAWLHMHILQTQKRLRKGKRERSSDVLLFKLSFTEAYSPQLPSATLVIFYLS